MMLCVYIVAYLWFMIGIITIYNCVCWCCYYEKWFVTMKGILVLYCDEALLRCNCMEWYYDVGNMSMDGIMMKYCCDDLLICNCIKLYCIVIHTKVWYVRNVRMCDCEMGKLSRAYSYPCEKWDWVERIVSLMAIWLI